MKRISGRGAAGRVSLRAAFLSLICVCLHGLLTGEARATAYTWTGLGVDFSWATTGNWLGGPSYPGLESSNDTVVFGVSYSQRFTTILTNNLDVANITYTMPGYTLKVTSFPYFINGITATYETAPNIENDGYLYFGSTLTVMNLTGTHGGFYSDGAPSTLQVLGSGTYYGHLRTDGSGILSLTVGDSTHAASLTLANTEGFTNYSGTTLVNANATLTAAATGALSASSPHVINGTLTLASGSHAVASLSGTGTVNLGANTLAIANGGAFSGAISGTGGSIIKSGTGTLSLTGSSSYSGGTTISAGSFLVEGTLSGTGVVNVAGGAIGGDGAMGGSLHFGLGSGIAFDASKTLTINGATVTFDGFSMANVIGLDSSVAPGIYALLDGTTAFDFTNVANFGAANGYDLGNGKYAYFQAGSFDVVVVPEPATWVLLACGGVALLVFFRRPSRFQKA